MAQLLVLDNGVTCRRDADFSAHETHECFTCLRPFPANPEWRCEKCQWLKCPSCASCACNLTGEQLEAMEALFRLFCINRSRTVRNVVLAMAKTFLACAEAERKQAET